MKVSILDYGRDELWRGQYIYIEDLDLELMLVDGLNGSDGLLLVQTSGYKSGLIYITLPFESYVSEKVLALSRLWLVNNYNHWFGDSTKIENVYVFDRY